MKFIFLLFFLMLGLQYAVQSQEKRAEPLNHLAIAETSDTTRVRILLDSSDQYAFTKTDQALQLAEEALDLARKLRYKNGEALALNQCGELFHFMGDFPKALDYQFEALQINRELKDLLAEAVTEGYIGIVYNELGEYRQALQYLLPANIINQQLNNPDPSNTSFVLSNIGEAYDFLKLGDSAIYFQRLAYQFYFLHPARPHLKSFIMRQMGDMYTELGKQDSALAMYHEVIINTLVPDDKFNRTMTQIKVAEVYAANRQFDSSFIYAWNALDNAKAATAKLHILRASNFLSNLYHELNRPDSAFFYLNIASSMRDSLYGPEKIRQLQVLMLHEQEKQQQILRNEESFRNRVKYFSLLSALGIFLLLSFILFRNNRQKQKTNLLLNTEKTKVEATLKELKSTQAQLVQSEKMASLGELTAGIAHEIQNPLNFVNNFAQVSNELLDEMIGEVDKGNTSDVKTIAENLSENLKKIDFHGKRADAIVKNMLQHSRSSSGQKELVDINSFADEYLRLTFQGLKVKDPGFDATIQTDFDPGAGKINIVPQDIGRVLQNLFSNAFYAVNEKSKTAIENYQPRVFLQTQKKGNTIEIKISDNGNGISQKAQDKIFQPFYTTKPTGEGTGLGLSLSYDIVKAHGGELKLLNSTADQQGAEFLVQLPAN